MTQQGALVAALVIGIGLLAGPAHAYVYKCKSASGAITFSDSPCPGVAATNAAPEQAVAEEPAAPAPGDEPVAAPDPLSVPQAPDTLAEPASAASPPPASPEPAAAVSAPPDKAAPAAPLRARKAKSGHWFVVGLGLLIAGIANISHIVFAWKADHKGFSFLIFVFSPLANIVYAALHFEKRLVPGFVGMVVGAVMFYAAFVPSVDLIDVSDSYTTASGEFAVDHRKPRKRFSPGEQVNLKTVLAWDDWSVESDHFVMWLWYTEGQVVGQYAAIVELGKDTNVLIGSMPAAALGEGTHAVEVYVDGELFDQREFRVGL